MDLPNAGQIAAAGRHVLSYSMGAVTALAALHVVSGDDAATISASISHISSGVAEVGVGLAPLIGLASAAWSAWTASHKSQIAAVNDSIPGVKVVRDTATAAIVTEPPPVPKPV